MKKYVGYIVINDDGRPLELSRYDKDEPLILVWGDRATIFPERKAARNAIRRTERYATKRNLNWRVWFDHTIVPLVTHEKEN